MPDAAQTLVDATIAISATLPTTQDLNGGTGYPSLTFVNIGQVVNWTPGGRLHAMTPSNPIAQRNTDFYKATNNDGVDNIVMNRDDDDAGQLIALAAEASDNAYAFEVTYQDSTIDYFQGKVPSYITGAGDANAIVTATLNVQRTGNTVVG